MSERLKSSSISNEEVVENLTKNLSSCLITENESDFVINPSSSDQSLTVDPGNHTVPSDVKSPTSSQTREEAADFDCGDLEDSNADNVKKKSDSDTDSIDELSLKDVEMTLTDDQKTDRRNLAEELKKEGNLAFQSGNHAESIEKYTQGLLTCPLQFPNQRAILYCNRAAAKMKLEKFKSAIKDCTKAIELDENYLKAYTRRAVCYETTDKLDESLADYKKILEMDPSNKEAQRASIRLPPLIEEKNEKLKTEMMGKLKDLGNMILKPFGLSTDNFQVQQDPESKGYKINFKQ